MRVRSNASNAMQCNAVVYYRSASHVKIDIDIGDLLPIFSQAVNNNNTHAIHPIPSHLQSLLGIEKGQNC